MLKIMKQLISFLILFVLGQTIQAQDCNGPAGKLTINKDPRIDGILYQRKNLIGKTPEMQGYRIQVYQGSNRYLAQRTKSDLENQYSNTVDIYYTYESSEFKIRLGDFRSRIEAQYLLHQLTEKYPSAFIVPAKIKFPRLN